ncbi:MAG: hypothetical protein IH960_07815 [Chloroflexi bacterium]|nr:hypothetical protein [Chloroflexota bacterium]
MGYADWQRFADENPEAFRTARWEPYHRLINEHYEVVDDPEVPSFLRGEMYVPVARTK